MIPFLNIPFFHLFQSMGGNLGTACNFIPYCNLIMTGFKIIILVFIVGWVRKRLGGGTLASVIMLIIGYFVLFPGWFLFGPLGVLWLIVLSHLTHLITTFGFAKGSLLQKEKKMQGKAEKRMMQEKGAGRYRNQ